MEPVFNHVYPDVPIPTPIEPVRTTAQQRNTHPQSGTSMNTGNEVAIFLFIMLMLVILSEGGLV